jgi:hypothetical protein
MILVFWRFFISLPIANAAKVDGDVPTTDEYRVSLGTKCDPLPLVRVTVLPSSRAVRGSWFLPSQFQKPFLDKIGHLVLRQNILIYFL